MKSPKPATDRSAPSRLGGLLRRCPIIVLVVLIPSWISWFLLERDLHATGHLLYYYIPDLTQAPLRLLPNFVVTPFINPQTDQIIIVTLLIATFGVLVERRLGAVPAFWIFWGTSFAAALGSGILLHILYPLFPDVPAFAEGGWYRVFNGASAGGFGLMGAYTALSPRPGLWVGAYGLWEASFWLITSGVFTTAFHLIAFVTGFFGGRYLRR